MHILSFEKKKKGKLGTNFHKLKPYQNSKTNFRFCTGMMHSDLEYKECTNYRGLFGCNI